MNKSVYSILCVSLIFGSSAFAQNAPSKDTLQTQIIPNLNDNTTVAPKYFRSNINIKETSKKDQLLANINKLKSLLEKLKQLRSANGNYLQGVSPINGGRISQGSSSGSGSGSSASGGNSENNRNSLIEKILAEINQTYKDIHALLEDDELKDLMGNELTKTATQIQDLQSQINNELANASYASIKESNPDLFVDYDSRTSELKSKVQEILPITSKAPLEKIEFDGPNLRQAVFSPDGILYVTTLTGIWKLEKGKLVRIVKASQVCSIAFDPNGVLYASMNFTDQQSSMWKMDNNGKFSPVQRENGFAECFKGLQVGDKGRIYASMSESGSEGIAVFKNDYSERIDINGLIDKLALGRDGTLYAATQLGKPIIWKIEKHSTPIQLSVGGPEMMATALAIDREGSIFVGVRSRNTDETILLKKERGKDFSLVQNLKDVAIFSIAINPKDDSIFVVGGENDRVVLYELN